MEIIDFGTFIVFNRWKLGNNLNLKEVALLLSWRNTDWAEGSNLEVVPANLPINMIHLSRDY